MAIRRILVAVDGSEPSFNASEYAIDLAKINVAELIVLSIVSPKASSKYDMGRMTDIEKTAMAVAQQEVDQVKQKASGKEVSVKTEVLVKYTSVIKEIVEYAEMMNIDMIVIGSKGKSGFKKLLLGSIASGVVTYSHCPVLVVK